MERMQTLLGDGYRVAYGMRYQNPPLRDAVEELVAAGCSQIVLLPLFPSTPRRRPVRRSRRLWE